jgi:hypothetical protein
MTTRQLLAQRCQGQRKVSFEIGREDYPLGNRTRPRLAVWYDHRADYSFGQLLA